MDKDRLLKTIDFWQKAALNDELFPRTLLSKIKTRSSEIIDIVGPRRSGKSSVLRLLIRNLKNDNNWLYLNFEDPFFIENNQPRIIEELIEVYKEYYNQNLKFLFFDEIQNIEKWEKAIRKLADGSHYKIYITGSSSKLLSRELSSLITGRHLSYELMPLTFEEFLLFNGIKVDSKKNLILQKTKLTRYFDQYLKTGGFPKIVLEKNEELLKQYYSDILEKDIIKRYDIRQKTILEKMGIFLISNAAKISSLSSLEKTFGISFEMASSYLEYFKEAFLIFELPQFSYSLKTQQKSLKKVYALDSGLARAVSFRFSEDMGRILENAIFLQLRLLTKEIFYYKTKNNLEVDFLVKLKKGDEILVQVCTGFDNEKTRQRELAALLEAMHETGITSGTVLTRATKDSMKLQGKLINVVPAYEWILDNELFQSALGKQ